MLITVISLLLFVFAKPLIAEEKIIKQEKMSFAQCLKVIEVSKDKLSIAPKISDVSTQKRVAIFSLVDGTLTITCDGVEGSVVVTINTN